MQLAVPAEAGLTGVRLGGVDVPEDQAAFPLFDSDYRVFTIWTVPDSGLVARLDWEGPDPLTVWLADRSPGVPDVAAALVRARPVTAVPIGGGDATFVFLRRELP
jgi:hypothetical protein